MKKVLGIVLVIVVVAAIAIFLLWPRGESEPSIEAVDNAFEQIAAALEAYRDEYDTYPPAYGFIKWDARNVPMLQDLQPRDYFLAHWAAAMELYDSSVTHDPFSTSHDADHDGSISLLEFVPEPEGGAARYDGENFPQLTDELKEAGPRPLFYIPVYYDDFLQAREFWVDRRYLHAEVWNARAPEVRDVRFPAGQYDAYALVSVGPAGNTFGVIPPDIVMERTGNGRYIPRTMYHVTAMRAFFLASRDLNENGLLDFDYRARTEGGEKDQAYSLGEHEADNSLPDETQPDADGPLIFVKTPY